MPTRIPASRTILASKFRDQSTTARIEEQRLLGIVLDLELSQMEPCFDIWMVSKSSGKMSDDTFASSESLSVLLTISTSLTFNASRDILRIPDFASNK